MIPSSLGKSEHEDIAARLIEKARLAGQWVALSYKGLVDQIADEADLEVGCNDRLRKEYERQQEDRKIGRQVARFFKGAYSALRGRKRSPQSDPVQAIEADKKKLPFSVVRFQALYNQAGGDAIGIAVRGMEERGLLNVLEHDGGHVLEPTPKLAGTIYKSQEGLRARGINPPHTAT
ncbi:MAG: hypothetical protein OXR66_01195 [Candidatus Woesearchaeota archaeon]|nr:hypothetical protein [Candidatus Woesearchaeota archaeon]